MKLIDYLKENNKKLTPELADILIINVKEMFPTIVESGKNKFWSNYKIVDYVMHLDLSDKDIMDILKNTSRYFNLIAFL